MTAGYFRAFLILNLLLVSVQSVKYVLRGQSVSLTPDIVIPHDVTLILWKHNGDKVVEFNGNEEQVYNTYEARVTLDWHSADLTINALTYEDSGKYDLEAYSKKLLTSHFDLQVIDKVGTPTVSCEMKDGSNTDERRKQATLSCSVDPTLTQSLVKFEWSSPGNKQSGSNLTISLGDEHDDKLYNCTVSNPLTTESATFTAKDCYSDKGSGATIAGICVAVLTVIAAVLMLVFCKLRHKACFAKTDVEKAEENNQGNHDDRKALLDRVSTIPSHQPLGRLVQNDPNSMDSVKDQQESTKTGPQKESDKLLDREEPGSNPFNNEEPNDELPVEMENRIEDTQTSLFEESESEKETDDDQGLKTPPATDFSPAAAAGPSLNNTPEEDTSESKANVSLEQMSGESREKAVEGSEKYSDGVKEDKKSTILQHQPEKTTEKMLNSGPIRSVGEGQEANEGSSNHAGDQENVAQVENQILVPESRFEHKQEISDVALEFVQDSDVDTKGSKEPESMNAECEMASPEQKEEETTPPKNISGPNEEEGYSRDDQEMDERTQSMSMKEEMREKATSIEALIPTSPKQDSHDVAAEVQSSDSGSVGYEESGRLNEESEGNSNHADEQEVVGLVEKPILESESLITLKQGNNEFAPESFKASHSDTMESKEPESLNEENEMASAEHREEDTTPQKQTSGQNHADDQRNVGQEKKYITEVESRTRHKEDDYDVAPEVQSSVADSKRYDESESMNKESKTASPEKKEEETTSQQQNSSTKEEEEEKEGYARQDHDDKRNSDLVDDEGNVTQERNMSSEAESPMNQKLEIHNVVPEVSDSDSETNGDTKNTNEETQRASPEHEEQETTSQPQNSSPIRKDRYSGEDQEGKEVNSNHADDQKNVSQEKKNISEVESHIRHEQDNCDVAPEVKSSVADSKRYDESESMNKESKTASPEKKEEETTSQQQNSGPIGAEGYTRQDLEVVESKSNDADDKENVTQGRNMSSEAESPMSDKQEIHHVAPEVPNSDSETKGDNDIKGTNEETKTASPEHEKQETSSQQRNSKPIIKHGDSGESQKGNEGNSNHSDDQRNDDQDEKLTFEAESLTKHKEENYDDAPEVQSSDLDSKGYKESESMNEESKKSSPENKVVETTSQQQNSGPKEEEEKEGYARKDQDNQSNSDLVDDEGNVIQGKYMFSEAESPMNQKLEIQNVAPEVSDSDSETNGDTKNTNGETKRASPEREEQETTSQPQNSGMKEEENEGYQRTPRS